MSDEPHFAQDFVLKRHPHMSELSCLLVASHTRVSEVTRSLEGTTFESVTHIGVCDNGKLVGIFRIEDLLSALPEAKVSGILDGDLDLYRPGPDFSKGILEKISVIFPEAMSVLPVRKVFWSDWGSPERVIQVQERLSLTRTRASGREPNRNVPARRTDFA